MLQRVIQSDHVARRLHVLLEDLHREHLPVGRRLHHERAQARLRDDPPGCHAELAIALEELDVAIEQERVEAPLAPHGSRFTGVERQGSPAVLTRRLDTPLVGHDLGPDPLPI